MKLLQPPLPHLPLLQTTIANHEIKYRNIQINTITLKSSEYLEIDI